MAKTTTIHGITQQILDVLGTPPNLVLVASKNIFDNRWRINFWCSRRQEGDCLIADHHIVHSYFVQVDKDQRIITPIPVILPTYKVPVPAPRHGQKAATPPLEEATAT